jgi:choline kinase
VEEGRLVSLSKDAPLESAGEYIGLARIDPEDGPALRAVLEDFVAREETAVYYEAAIEALARDRPVSVASVAGLVWAEIDDRDDLARAEREVLANV